tara:strand:- start:80 stop:586 length:507 start_codon:yes stop_codon:yes gene_type:complete
MTYPRVPQFIKSISVIAKNVRFSNPFGGKESHFQAMLEKEIQNTNNRVLSEVIQPIHFKPATSNNETLPYGLYGREDLTLPDKNCIIELKATKKLSQRDFFQLFRYMTERNMSGWGLDTHGMLINFGHDDIDIWYSSYDTESRMFRINILKEEIPPLEHYVDTYDFVN